MNPASNLDAARDVRIGEELDIERVDTWLKTQLPSLKGHPRVQQYSGGASNWTYNLTYDDCELILRRAPKGQKAKGAHDMDREYHLQKSLKPSFALVPNMIALCQDQQIIGSDFYVMEKLTGIIPRKNLPRSLVMSAQEVNALCKNMIKTLAHLHEVNLEQAGLTNLAKGEGYLDRQISGWTQRYAQAKTWNVPSGTLITNWLQHNKPSQETICLTHNDFRFDNLVLNPNQPSDIIGVLDWELATLGDPLMDLGNTLAYWVQADDDFLAQKMRRQPTHLAGMMTRQQVIDYYAQLRGLRPLDITFYEVFGLFRLAAIAQQIYYRYHHKQTNNPAFKNFWVFVHYLLWRCKKAIKQQRS